MDRKKMKKTFDKLEEDYFSFRAYYMKNKKCPCDPLECRHFEEALVSVLGGRTDKMMRELLSGAREFACEVEGIGR